jgi:hypothetical protein
MTDHPPPDPPLNVAFLSAFVNKSRWMAKHGDWKERLLYRLARAYLDVLTREAITGSSGGQGAETVPKPEGKWTRRVKK